MNTIINFLSGRVLAPIWDFLDGKKTALASGAGILAGVAGLAAQLVPLLSAHDTAGLVSLIKSLPADPSYLLIVGSLGALGIGHKIDKAAEAPKP
jgi:hypothetical protein